MIGGGYLSRAQHYRPKPLELLGIIDETSHRNVLAGRSDKEQSRIRGESLVLHIFILALAANSPAPFYLCGLRPLEMLSLLRYFCYWLMLLRPLCHFPSIVTHRTHSCSVFCSRSLNPQRSLFDSHCFRHSP